MSTANNTTNLGASSSSSTVSSLALTNSSSQIGGVILPNPNQPADPAKIESQAKQISNAARELATASEKIISWSSAKVEESVNNVYKDKFQVVEGVAVKLACQRAHEIAKGGEKFLSDVDELKKTVTEMRTVLRDVRKVSKQLNGLEGILDAMSADQQHQHQHQQQQRQQQQHH